MLHSCFLFNINGDKLIIDLTQGAVKGVRGHPIGAFASKNMDLFEKGESSSPQSQVLGPILDLSVKRYVNADNESLLTYECGLGAAGDDTARTPLDHLSIIPGRRRKALIHLIEGKQNTNAHYFAAFRKHRIYHRL